MWKTVRMCAGGRVAEWIAYSTGLQMIDGSVQLQYETFLQNYIS